MSGGKFENGGKWLFQADGIPNQNLPSPRNSLQDSKKFIGCRPQLNHGRTYQEAAVAAHMCRFFQLGAMGILTSKIVNR